MEQEFNIDKLFKKMQKDLYVSSTKIKNEKNSNLLIHSQNPCYRTLTSATAAVFCSFISGLLIRQLDCITINCMQLSCQIATAQLVNVLKVMVMDCIQMTQAVWLWQVWLM